MKNAISWFEIPVKNFDRAKKFYEEVLQVELENMDMGDPDSRMAVFPSDGENGGVGGSIFYGEGYEPSRQGSLIYLNGGDDLSEPLSRVENAGGKILLDKMAIGKYGFIAQFSDTEGNRIAFHSMN